MASFAVDADVSFYQNPAQKIRYEDNVTGDQGQRGELPIYITALFGGCDFCLNAKLLLTLRNNKRPLGIDPGGHHFMY